MAPFDLLQNVCATRNPEQFIAPEVIGIIFADVAPGNLSTANESPH